MSDPIKPGDVVMVVRVPHACVVKYLWNIYTVSDVGLCQWQCGICGHLDIEVFATISADGGGFPIKWLKKLDPSAERKSVEREEEVTA